VPGQDTGRIAFGGLIPELPVFARPLGVGLQALSGVTLHCSRLAWSLAGSADRLVKTAIACGADVENAGEGDDRPRYSLHWISPYESDGWD
jgi:hypothetical protein